MPNVIELSDQEKLVGSKEFPFAKFPFEYFNPVQSRLFEIYDKDCNVIVAAATSAGKTVCSEMLLSYEINKRGGKGMYTSPLKSLSQEKINDWSDPSHDFSKLNRSICTGDYRLTKDRQDELSKANIIITTTEMLNSKSRNFKSDGLQWLGEIGTLVTDECHLVGVPTRGPKSEIGLMKMAKINKNCRHMFLSATVPNVDEIAGWLTKLTDRDTCVIKSTYRPCPLELHYPMYDDSVWKYEAKEQQKINTAIQILKQHPNDKFLIFVHSKKTGNMLLKILEKFKFECDFYKADLSLKRRIEIENRFKNDSSLKVLIATSSLSWGVNLPSRRVIILGVHRGLTLVDKFDIDQEVGRAGRPKYDPKGDAYILLPRKDYDEQLLRVTTPQPVRSQLIPFGSDDYRELAFHVINEVYQGDIETIKDIYIWYSHTLASHQRRGLDEYVVDDMVEKLIKRGAVKLVDDKLQITPVGQIASMFYYSPFDIADLKQNFTTLFEMEKEYDETWAAVALAKIDSNKQVIANSDEIEQMGNYADKLTHQIRNAFGGNKAFTPALIKMSYCYYQLLHGYSNQAFDATLMGLKMDSERLFEVLTAINGMATKWSKSDYLKRLGKKINYGVDWRVLDLCEINGIAAVKAKKLYVAGIKTPKDLVQRPMLARSVLKCSEMMLGKYVESAIHVLSSRSHNS